MTGHSRSMSERLPLLYRDGDLVRVLLDVLGLQVEILDESARRVQRRHWFDTAPDFDDAAKLGALLDIEPEPWQGLGEYRAWFHALRTARLRHGASTVEALQSFVRDYAEAFERADAVQVVAPFDEGWSPTPTHSGHAFVEQPIRVHSTTLASGVGIEPLHRQEVVNGGLDQSTLSWLMTATADGPEYVPVLANLTARTAVVYQGTVDPGQRLWIRGAPDGTVVAELEGRDVVEHFRTVTGFEPGRSWTLAEAGAVSALPLLPGANELWFLPVAHYDEPGLDRVLLALAELDLRQGRWDETEFDHALFYQEPAAVLQLLWREATPATVQIDLDASTMRSPAAELEAAMLNREQLATSLDTGVRSLSAAGVATSVRMRPLVSSQRQHDRLVATLPMHQKEVGVTGIDSMPDMGGVYGASDFDESIYR